MTEIAAFTEMEQEVTDITWYAVDAEGRVGHFMTGGGVKLPPTLAKSKAILEKLDNYFSNLRFIQEGKYIICPDLTNHLNKRLITNLDGYLKPSAEMSARGLYSNNNHSVFDDRPYFRVTILKQEIKLSNLSEEISGATTRCKFSRITLPLG